MDRDLVLRAKEGDVRAFEELVHRYDRRVLSMAAMYTQNPEDARDVYQEVFLRAFRGLPRFDQRSRFSTWLYRIATNACLSHVSRRKKREHEPLDEAVEVDSRGTSGGPARGAPQGGATLGEELHSRALLRGLRRAMERLSPQQRLVVTLRHYEGFKMREIAELLGCSEGTVKKQLFTALRKMRSQMEAAGGA
jgi:RNA polymerase sigma-70 factor (ECF subfamily)